MRELECLLPTLEPPAGGLDRLQRHVAAKRRSQHALRTRWAWAAAVCVLLVLAIARLPQWIVQRQRMDALTSAWRQGMSPNLPANGIRVAHGAAIELPSGQANVRLYLVQTAPSVASGK